MPDVLVYESSGLAGDIDSLLLTRLIVRLGIFWTILQLASSALGCVVVVLIGQASFGIIRWILMFLQICALSALLVVSILLHKHDAPPTTARRHIGTIVVALFLIAIANFAVDVLQPGQLQFLGLWNLLVLCIEAGSQDLSTFMWPVVMFCALPGRRFTWLQFSPARAITIGATVLCLLITVRFSVPHLYANFGGKLRDPLTGWFDNPAEVCVTMQIIGAVSAGSIIMIAGRSGPHRFDTKVCMIIAMLVVVPALSHPIANFLDFPRGAFGSFSRGSRRWLLLSMVAWNLARCIPVIALPYAAFKLRRTRS